MGEISNPSLIANTQFEMLIPFSDNGGKGTQQGFTIEVDVISLLTDTNFSSSYANAIR